MIYIKGRNLTLSIMSNVIPPVDNVVHTRN